MYPGDLYSLWDQYPPSVGKRTPGKICGDQSAGAEGSVEIKDRYQAGDRRGGGRCSGTVYHNFRGETPQKA